MLLALSPRDARLPAPRQAGVLRDRISTIAEWEHYATGNVEKCDCSVDIQFSQYRAVIERLKYLAAILCAKLLLGSLMPRGPFY